MQDELTATCAERRAQILAQSGPALCCQATGIRKHSDQGIVFPTNKISQEKKTEVTLMTRKNKPQKRSQEERRKVHLQPRYLPPGQPRDSFPKTIIYKEPAETCKLFEHLSPTQPTGRPRSDNKKTHFSLDLVIHLRLRHFLATPRSQVPVDFVVESTRRICLGCSGLLIFRNRSQHCPV